MSPGGVRSGWPRGFFAVCAATRYTLAEFLGTTAKSARDPLVARSLRGLHIASEPPDDTAVTSHRQRVPGLRGAALGARFQPHGSRAT